MTCPTGKDVARAARLILSGGLVAIPTETVYGLGANAFDETAVARLFEVKNRPRFDPLIVHVSDASWIGRLTFADRRTLRPLTDRFWPGPLTLVLPKRPCIPDLVTAGLDTVGVRVPDHPFTLELLRKADVPIAAPSANPFGCLSPTTAQHVADQLGNRIDYILDGGPCRVGVESTVLQLSQHSAKAKPRAVLLRPGGVSVEDLETAIGPVTIPAALRDEDENSRAHASPGMLSRHYAPATPLVVSDEIEPPPPGQRVGLLTLRPVADPGRFAAVEVLSPGGDLVEAAAGFFAALRRLDAQNFDAIIARPFPESGLGRALNDRLRRAAHK